MFEPDSTVDQPQPDQFSARAPLDWRRNLVWLWVVNAVTQFGVYSALPFIPLYIQQDLGVRNPHDVAFWVGVSGSAVGLGLILTGPGWGRAADRFGRKSLALRATAIGGLFVALTAIVQTPLQLAGIRFLTGSVAGNQSAITALVSSETPNTEVAWALGLIGSATAVGRALGPVVGGVLVALIGLRYQFVVGGLLMAGAAIPLVFLVRETDRRHEPSRRMSLGKLIRTMSPSQMRTLGLLLTLVAAAQVLNFTLTQFLGLRVVETVGANANLIIGLTFAVFGGCTALGALTYASIVTRVGYKPVAAWSMGLFGLGMVGVAISRQPALIVAAAAGMGIAFGASFPVLNTMVGLESPEPVRATVFGVGNSLVGLGFVIVPALAGLVASAVSVSAALLCLAVGAGLCTVALLLFSHEPQQVS